MEKNPSETQRIDDLAYQVINALNMKNLTLTCAESATGGLLSHSLTNISGASKFFIGGIVCYTAQSKNTLLDVDWEIINDYGTVSPEVTDALLNGMKKIGADLGLAITGVAGVKIEGKTPGLIYIGVSNQICNKIHKFKFSGTRLEIKTQAVHAAFKLLLEELEKS